MRVFKYNEYYLTCSVVIKIKQVKGEKSKIKQNKCVRGVKSSDIIFNQVSRNEKPIGSGLYRLIL